jgi:hypothetical protein
MVWDRSTTLIFLVNNMFKILTHWWAAPNLPLAVADG